MSANENFTASDRELLELAAKAAGIDVYESTDGTMQNRPVWVFSGGGGMGTMPYEVRWNPLVDDAQALRLAVKVDAWPVRGRAVPGDWSRSNFIRVVIDGVRVDEVFTTDPYAATRRAIVRAAASIGAAL